MKFLHELIREAEKLDGERMADEKRRLRIENLLKMIDSL
jgi:hypothetical protein